jgi:uncharacterized protein (DUF302 family)
MPIEYRRYGLRRVLAADFDITNARVREALKAEGFGVLTEIDVQATMKQKLDVEFPPYVIIGACNPPLAQRALTAEPEVGLLLPCNVVVRREDGATIVEALDPAAAMNLSGNPAVAAVAEEARSRLIRVLESL